MINAIIEYAQQQKIKVIFTRDKLFKAFCFDDNGKQYIVINETYFKSTEQLAAALLHEIGHCMTNAFYEIKRTPLSEQMECEQKADEWANAHKDKILKTVNH